MSRLAFEIIKYAGKRGVIFTWSTCHSGASNNDILFVTIALCTEKYEKPFHPIHLPYCITFCAKLHAEYRYFKSYSNTCRFTSFELNTLPRILQWESGDTNRWINRWTRIMEIPNWSPRLTFLSTTELEHCKLPQVEENCCSLETFFK